MADQLRCSQCGRELAGTYEHQYCPFCREPIAHVAAKAGRPAAGPSMAHIIGSDTRPGSAGPRQESLQKLAEEGPGVSLNIGDVVIPGNESGITITNNIDRREIHVSPHVKTDNGTNRTVFACIVGVVAIAAGVALVAKPWQQHISVQINQPMPAPTNTPSISISAKADSLSAGVAPSVAATPSPSAPSATPAPLREVVPAAPSPRQTATPTPARATASKATLSATPAATPGPDFADPREAYINLSQLRRPGDGKPVAIVALDMKTDPDIRDTLTGLMAAVLLKKGYTVASGVLKKEFYGESVFDRVWDGDLALFGEKGLDGVCDSLILLKAQVTSPVKTEFQDLLSVQASIKIVRIGENGRKTGPRDFLSPGAGFSAAESRKAALERVAAELEKATDLFPTP